MNLTTEQARWAMRRVRALRLAIADAMEHQAGELLDQASDAERRAELMQDEAAALQEAAHALQR
jgi:urease gamma subunit